MKEPVTRLDYCQYLLVTQINYTLTHFAEHTERFSHDAINRYLRGERITPRLVWDHVRDQVVPTSQGYIVCDDTVLDKNYSSVIDLVRRQYSGNAKAVIKGIGVVTCVYVNPEIDQFWVIDYRIYDPAGNGYSKLDHVREMLRNVVYQKALPFQAVLMDTWYATKDVMLFIESLQKHYYCPLKDNRQVDDSGGQQPYQRVDSLIWNATELAQRVSTVLCKCPLIHSTGNRPSNRMANRFSARFQSFTGIVHFLAACSIARYTTFNAERSLGKIRRLWMALRITLLRDSIALVV